jgi:hypothetical protein
MTKDQRGPVSLSRPSLNRQRESSGGVTRRLAEDHLSLVPARRWLRDNADTNSTRSR